MRLGVWWLKGAVGAVYCIEFWCGDGVMLSVLWLGVGESGCVQCRELR